MTSVKKPFREKPLTRVRVRTMIVAHKTNQNKRLGDIHIWQKPLSVANAAHTEQSERNGTRSNKGSVGRTEPVARLGGAQTAAVIFTRPSM